MHLLIIQAIPLRWYEQHGHNNLDIYLDTQRPMLIDINIRELAHFIEIVKLDIKKDKRGNVIALKWLVRHIENSALFDKYMSSGKKDSTCFIEEIIVADYNVFECYDSQSCKPKFYALSLPALSLCTKSACIKPTRGGDFVSQA